jgi:hypothetical protein
MFSEEYLAGFVDADGHLSVRARAGARPDLEFSLSQSASRAAVLLYAPGLFGGIIRPKFGGAHFELCLRSGPARRAIERLKSYLVLKRVHAEMFLGLVNRGVVLKNRDDVRAVRQRVQEIRKCGATLQPSYPSGEWMAGYVDGDGSFVVKVCKKTRYAYPSLTILAASNYLVGIMLLRRVFGGQIQSSGKNAVWRVSLN